MPTVSMVNFSGNKIGEAALPDQFFGIEPNAQVVSEYVRMYLANQRLGTANTKNRSRVAGGGIKPYRQKGTGRARQGTVRAPHFVGGGRAFGPQPRDFHYSIPRKKKQLALKSVLSDRVQNEKCLVLEKLDLIDKKTKEIASFINGLDLTSKNYLIVLGEYNDVSIRCIRNIRNVDVKLWSNLNAYDVLKNETIILEKNILDNFDKGTDDEKS